MSVICYMSVIRLVLGGVVRVRLYVIYAHLCNHMLLRSGGDLGHSSVHRQRCGFWESGCRRLARRRPARRGSGAPSTDWLGAWGCLFRSHDLLDWSTLSLSGNKTQTKKEEPLFKNCCPKTKKPAEAETNFFVKRNEKLSLYFENMY